MILSEDSTPSAQHASLGPLLTLKSKFLEHKPLGVTNKPNPNHSRPKNLVEVSTHSMHAETKEQDILQVLNADTTCSLPALYSLQS